jgi:anthranilate synthase component 1
MPDGSLDFAIAIRTVVMQNAEFSVTAGAGIVEGSVPELEAQETRNKAQAALAAIRAAQDAVGDRERRLEQRRIREAKQAERLGLALVEAAKAAAEEGGAAPPAGGGGESGS